MSVISFSKLLTLQYMTDTLLKLALKFKHNCNNWQSSHHQSYLFFMVKMAIICKLISLLLKIKHLLYKIFKQTV